MDSRYIEEVIKKDINSLGCQIWGIEYVGKPNNQTLRIYIDKEKGVSIEDCEKVSKQISRVLQVDNSINEGYYLEVSSPGIERKFFKNSQYYDYIGDYLKVRFLEENHRFKTEKGILEEVSKGGIVLKGYDKEIEITFDAIQKANIELKKE